jgi:membrane protein
MSSWYVPSRAGRLEHQTARESTTGSPKPLGRRGAKMADPIGAARA